MHAPWYQFMIYYFKDYLHVWPWERIQEWFVTLSPETCIIGYPVPLKLRPNCAADLNGRQFGIC